MTPPTTPSADTVIATRRLRLRPFAVADAERVVEIQSNWNVMRMLREATFPATLASTRAWLASHRSEWRDGTAYRFAAEEDGRLVGCADLDEIAGGRGHVGYWFDEGAWGRGLATEAGRGLVAWAFGVLGLEGLNSGCASDNLASAAVLRKLGFRQTGRTQVWSNPRGGLITQIQWALDP